MGSRAVWRPVSPDEAEPGVTHSGCLAALGPVAEPRRPSMTRDRAKLITLSLPEARRLAVHAQGFGARPVKPSMAHLRRLASRLHAFQIDSVNVVTRAHYVPAFARLGPYSTDALDALTYQKRELFEYWGHAACLLPISLFAFVRYRMVRHAERTLAYMRTRRGAYLARIFDEVRERGPISAAELSDPRKRAGSWWGWMGSVNGKAALEHLYDAGLVAISGRRRFERVYDLTERVIPQAVVDAPALPPEEAMKELICRGAQACGVGTFGDITGYFYVGGWSDRVTPGPRWERANGSRGRRAKPITRRLVSELVEEGRLFEARVEGWKETAYVAPRVRVPSPSARERW
jgi:uncharacterized protein